MDGYKEHFARTLAETGAIFFDKRLVLKDGRPTPYFVNMAMFKTGRLALEMGSFFAGMMVSRGMADQTDIILGPSYKGSAIALSTAIALWQEHQIDLAFEYDRKEAKTHGEGSVSQSIFVNRSLFDGCRIFVVDDVATSMGTKFELLEKLDSEARSSGQSYHVIGIGIGLDREQTTAVYDSRGKVVLGQRGENAIEDFVSRSGIPVLCVAGIRDVVAYLYKEKVPVMIEGRRMPIDEKTMAEFDDYINRYGVS
ncbi:MAG: orotate phosphoribosyltransferase [Syntrophorhabdus sp.]